MHNFLMFFLFMLGTNSFITLPKVIIYIYSGCITVLFVRFIYSKIKYSHK